MAVRFDAEADAYTASPALGARANLTMCAWVMLSVDRNAFQAAFGVDNAAADSLYMETDSTGTMMRVVRDNASADNLVEMTVGGWYFLAFASAGGSGTAYWRTAAAAALSSFGWSGSSADTNVATLRLGRFPNAGEWLNGRVAAVKLWTATLSLAELDRESRQVAPSRYDNLQAFYPLKVAETTDYGPNGFTLTGGAGVTTEASPDLPWQSIGFQSTSSHPGRRPRRGLWVGRAWVDTSEPGEAPPPSAEQIGEAHTGATATAEAAKVAAVTARAAGCVQASAAAVKVATDTACAAGSLLARATAVKVAPQSGPAAVAASAAGGAQHAAAGCAAAGPAAAGTAAKVTAASGRSTVGLAAATLTPTSTGRAAAGTSAAGAAVKVAAVTGRCNGSPTAGVSAAKTVQPTGHTQLAPTVRASVAKLAGPAARCAGAGLAHGGAARRIAGTGASYAAFTCAAVPGRVVPTTGRVFAGLVALGPVGVTGYPVYGLDAATTATGTDQASTTGGGQWGASTAAAAGTDQGFAASGHYDGATTATGLY